MKRALLKDFTSAGEIRASDFYQFYYCKRKILIEKVYGYKRLVKDKMIEGSEEHRKERKRLLERTEVYGIRKEDVEEVLENFCMSYSGISGCPDITVKKKDGSVVIVELKLTDFQTDSFARRAQIYAYAFLAKKFFSSKKVLAYIYYIKQKKLERIAIPEDVEVFVEMTLREVKALIESEKLPEVPKSSRCSYCEFYSFCWA